jgi:hypothetical protein
VRLDDAPLPLDPLEDGHVDDDHADGDDSEDDIARLEVVARPEAVARRDDGPHLAINTEGGVFMSETGVSLSDLETLKGRD